MKSIWNKLKSAVLRVTAKAISGPEFLAGAVCAASLSVAHSLAKLLKMGVAEDIRDLTDSAKQFVVARVEAEEAKTQKLLAEAADAASKRSITKRNDRISRAEERQKLAEAAKVNAEAEALLLKAKSDSAKATAEAFGTLIDAINRLQHAGGKVALDPKAICKMLGIAKLEELGEEPPLPPSIIEAEEAPTQRRPKKSGKARKKRS